MKCFHHPDAEAVGVCKHCQKGLCRDCAVDLGSGLACPGACVDAVRRTSVMVERATSEVALRLQGSYFGALFMTVLGAVFVATPLFSGQPFEWTSFSTVSGLVFAGFGIVLGVFQRAVNRAARRGRDGGAG